MRDWMKFKCLLVSLDSGEHWRVLRYGNKLSGETVDASSLEMPKDTLDRTLNLAKWDVSLPMAGGWK